MASISLVRQIASQAGRVLSGGAQVVGRISRSGAGRAIGGGVASGAALAGAERFFRGSAAPRGRRRRAHGVTASDIRGAKRVMSFVKEFGYKPKMNVRARRRKR